MPQGISESQPAVIPSFWFPVSTWVPRSLPSTVCHGASQLQTQRPTFDEFTQITTPTHYTVPVQPPIYHNISHPIKRRKEGNRLAYTSIASILECLYLKIAFIIFSSCGNSWNSVSHSAHPLATVQSPDESGHHRLFQPWCYPPQVPHTQKWRVTGIWFKPYAVT